MYQRWKFSILVLALAVLSLDSWGGSANATLVGAQCWDDGLCKITGCDPWDTDCGPEPNTLVYLSVKRYTTATLSNADVDAILTEANDILQTGGITDTECPVEFLRSGSVTSFTTGDGSIDSQSEFDTLIALSGKVKIVNAINWCGAIIPNVVGCSPMPGSSQLGIRFGTTHQEAIMWAHEYGHTRGLAHRAGTYVMNGTIANANTRVTATECTAYKN